MYKRQSHYVVAPEKIAKACDDIEEELKERVKYFKSEDKLLEAQRISERTKMCIRDRDRSISV